MRELLRQGENIIKETGRAPTDEWRQTIGSRLLYKNTLVLIALFLSRY